jgi:GH24 family phage-related lysozyme (muramidase)
MKRFKWNHAEGKEIAGLKTRREAELALWCVGQLG